MGRSEGRLRGASRSACCCATYTLRTDGSLVPVDGKIGQGLSLSLSSDLVWVGQAEASSQIGAGSRAPAAIGLSADGTRIEEAVFLGGQRLLGLRDQTRYVAPGALEAIPSTAPGPSPRSGFGAVYSRADGRVFVVGGNDPQTHQPTGDIWYRDAVGGAGWFRVDTSGYAPQTVLAATFSYADHRLWVLDEAKVGQKRIARLVRLDPAAGQSETLGSWPRSAAYDKHWLVLDSDGSILLVASSSKLNRHFVIRVDNGVNPPLVGSVVSRHRALAMAPAVDLEGYSFVEVHGKNKIELTRLPTLTGKPGHWDSVGDYL